MSSFIATANQHYSKGSSHCSKMREKNNNIKGKMDSTTWKVQNKILFIEDMITYIANPRKSSDN